MHIDLWHIEYAWVGLTGHPVPLVLKQTPSVCLSVCLSVLSECLSVCVRGVEICRSVGPDRQNPWMSGNLPQSAGQMTDDDFIVLVQLELKWLTSFSPDWQKTFFVSPNVWQVKVNFHTPVYEAKIGVT